MVNFWDKKKRKIKNDKKKVTKKTKNTRMKEHSVGQKKLKNGKIPQKKLKKKKKYPLWGTKKETRKNTLKR